MMSLRKRLLFTFLPVLLFVILLVIVEGALRFFSPDLASPFVREVTINGVEWYQVNRRYLERYFPASAATIPELKPSFIRKQKVDGILRVFCLGESSMFGTPYEMSATIPALVRKQLRHLFPGREIEVINFGASAINSNVLVDVAPELVRLRPDVMLLYTGHNEFYGPDGIGASWIEQRFPSFTALKYTLRDMRLIRLAQRLLTRASAVNDRNLMKQVSEGAAVDLRSDDAERVFQNFNRNMHTLLATFRDAHISVIVSDVTSNLSFAPFSVPEKRDFPEIRKIFNAGRYGEIIDRLSTLIRSDSNNAFLHYWMGRSLEARGDSANALDHLRRARDEDLLKFRAPGRINEIVRETCRREGMICLSADSLFSAHSPGGITDLSLFCEHLHPNLRGYDLIARMFVTAMLRTTLTARAEHHDAQALLPFDPDSLSICWLDLAYADLSLRNLTGKWPFTDFKSTPVVLSAASPAHMQIALDVYNRKIGWTEGCYRCAEAFQGLGGNDEAMRILSALIDESPQDFYPQYRLAVLLKDLGDGQRARQHYAACLGLKPDYPQAQVDLGLLENNAGDFTSAIDHLSEAVKITEGQNLTSLRAQAFYGLAAALANTGNIAKARDYLDQSLRLSPQYRPARELAKALRAQH